MKWFPGLPKKEKAFWIEVPLRVIEFTAKEPSLAGVPSYWTI